MTDFNLKFNDNDSKVLLERMDGTTLLELDGATVESYYIESRSDLEAVRMALKTTGASNYYKIYTSDNYDFGDYDYPNVLMVADRLYFNPDKTVRNTADGRTDTLFPVLSWVSPNYASDNSACDYAPIETLSDINDCLKHEAFKELEWL